MPLKNAGNVLLLLAITLCAETIFGRTHETGFLNRSLSFGGETYRYQVYVPAEFTLARKWPVVLFLHGAGERGDDGVMPTDHGIGTAIRRGARRFPAVVVFPQCRRDSIWFGSMEEQALQALDLSIKEFNGDRRRIYLTGISLGGYGTWQVAARHPGKFAALVPVAGGVVAPAGFPFPPEVAALASSGDPYMAIIRSSDPYSGRRSIDRQDSSLGFPRRNRQPRPRDGGAEDGRGFKGGGWRGEVHGILGRRSRHNGPGLF